MLLKSELSPSKKVCFVCFTLHKKCENKGFIDLYSRENMGQRKPVFWHILCSVNESPLKVMKNAFYFIVKTLFVPMIFKFFSWHFWCYVENEKRLDKKVQFSFKTYDVTTWEQTITIHILPNTSRSKVNQIIIFKNHAERCRGTNSGPLFLFFKKA